MVIIFFFNSYNLKLRFLKYHDSSGKYIPSFTFILLTTVVGREIRGLIKDMLLEYLIIIIENKV